MNMNAAFRVKDWLEFVSLPSAHIKT